MKKIILVLFIGFGFFCVKAQQLDFGFNNYLQVSKSGDLGLSINYSHPLSKNALFFSLEMRSIDWGNQLGFGFGYNATYKAFSKFKVGGTSATILGLALFRQNSMASYGFAYTPYLEWSSNKSFYASLGLGIRYNWCPAYKKHGINTQLEFPLELKWGFRLGKNGAFTKDAK